MKYKELRREALTAGEAVERLDKITSILRSEEGCPWDKAQTYESIKACLIEEAYEVTDAVDREDWDNLEEELGDVLLQVVFYSNLGKDDGRFDLKTLANRICDKMIYRHPHVFSNNKAESIDMALERWEDMKKIEKKQTLTESMSRIPKFLPALRKSIKIQKKAAEVGFDWDSVKPAFHKLVEETEELKEACREGNQERIRDELGDMLFAVTNIARFLKVDPEDALNFTSQRFIDRFRHMEKTAEDNGCQLESMNLKDLDKLWEAAKERESIVDKSEAE